MAAKPQSSPPAIVVMGVSGCGKSHVGETLAKALPNALFTDGDDLHPPANVTKMRAGSPLTDDDRLPWLEAVREVLATGSPAAPAVVACSSLKRSYRDILRGAGNGLRFLHLVGDRELILTRMSAREGHFMPTSLLDDQFTNLESAAEDEGDVTEVAINPPAEEIVAAFLSALASQ